MRQIIYKFCLKRHLNDLLPEFETAAVCHALKCSFSKYQRGKYFNAAVIVSRR
jgi:hypothetical protein